MRLLRSNPWAKTPDLRIEVTDHDDSPVLVRVSGDLDLASVPQLRSCLADQIGGGRAHLVIDLSGVTFCDSTALGVFIGAHRRAVAARGDIEFRDPPPELRRLFTVSGLDSVLCVT